MNLLGWLKLLCLLSNIPKPNFSIWSTWNNVIAIISSAETGYSSISLVSWLVCVINNPKKLSTLWEECPDFAIGPAWDETFAIAHKIDTVALGKVIEGARIQFDFEEFFLGGWRPEPNFVLRARSEYTPEALREHHVVDGIEVAAHELLTLLDTGVVIHRSDNASATHVIHLAFTRC